MRVGVPETAEEMFESAPCGFLYTTPAGLIVRINRTLLAWIGYNLEELESKLRLQDLLSPGGRILYQTHVALLLDASGEMTGVTLDLQTRDGGTLPVLMSATQQRDKSGQAQFIRFTLFDARERRTYELQLLAARKQAEADASRLAAQEHLLRLALSGSHGAVWSWSVAENQFGWDAEYYELYGFRAEEIRTFEHWVSRLHPDDRLWVEGRLKALLKPDEESEWNLEFRTLHPTKGERWVWGRGRVERDQAGRAMRLLGLHFDVTQLKLSEQALQAAETKLQLGLDLAGLALAEVNYHSGTFHLTAAAAQLFGLGQSAATLPREAVHSTFHPDDAEELHRRIAIALDPTGPGRFGMDHRIKLADGAVRWLRVQKRVEFEGAGSERRPLRATLAAMDVTAEKNAELELRTGEERFRQLADSMPQLVWSTLPDGFCDFHNQRWVEYTGLSLEASLGTGWVEAVHPDDLPVVIDKWMLSLATAEVYEAESRYRRFDGQYRWFLLRAVPAIGPDGRIVRWFGTSTDIHDTKKLEEALQRSNEDLKYFVYGASHDLRAPIRAIVANTHRIQNLPGSQLDERARELLNRLEQTARNMYDLISQLLSYAEATGSADEMPAIPVAAHRTFETIMKILDPVVQETQATVTKDPLPAVLVYEAHLHAVFQNLIGNALKFRKDDEAPKIHVSAVRDGPYWRFSISDNGIGIAPEYRERVFGVFKRLNPSEGRFAGTGLGLAICKKIVERYEGRIWVESAPGRGSTFHFTLPAAESVGAAAGVHAGRE